MRNSSILALVLSGFLVSTTFGGGPLLVDGHGAILWDTSTPIVYRVDPGGLRDADPALHLRAITSDEMRQAIAAAFKVWQSVPTAMIAFQDGGFLASDIQTGPQYLALRDSANAGSFIVLDKGGKIIDAVAGAGNSNFILGWASPVRAGSRIVRFYSLMNGKLATSVDQFRPTLVHEFGHAIGLDHSQIQAGLANDGNPLNDKAVPIMFPTSCDSEDHQPPLARNLHSDDIAWLSRLYPNPQNSGHFGVIHGHVLRDGHEPVLGANVVAVDRANTEDNRYSCVSDFDMKGTGEFEMFVLPGKYTLFVEPILSKFVGGSAVGPYATDSLSPSFTVPIEPQEYAQIYELRAGESTRDIVLSAKSAPSPTSQP